MDEHAKLTQDFNGLAVARAFNVNYSNKLFFKQNFPLETLPFQQYSQVHTYTRTEAFKMQAY